MNTNDVFDAISKATTIIILQDKITEKQAQVRSVLSKLCGNCNHWMKLSCGPEKKHGKLKSCNSTGCDGFSLCQYNVDMAEKFQKELEELNRQMRLIPLPLACN